MSPEPINIGIVGAGQIASDVHLPVLQSTDGVRVAWITDVDEARAREIAEAFRTPHTVLPRQLTALPPCEVALLAIPVHVREPYYSAFAARGTAVLAEKPFAMTANDHRRFARGFDPTRIACGYMRRFYASTELLRAAVAERWFGELRRVRIEEGNRTTKTGVDATFQDRSSREGGGVLLAIGCHLLDLALHVSGAESFRILEREVFLDHGTDRHATGSIDLLDLHGRQESSCRLQFAVSWLEPCTDRIDLEFDRIRLTAGLGPAGRVEIANSAGERKAVLDSSLGGATTTNQGFYLEWRDFLDGLIAGRRSRISAESCLLTTRLVEELLGERSGA